MRQYCAYTVMYGHHGAPYKEGDLCYQEEPITRQFTVLD